MPGNQACAAANQRAIDPANPGVFFPTAFAGNIVPGSGQQLNGIITGGMEGRKDGTYFTFPYFVYAPRAGMAWNVTGDGKTALRTSWGIFYNFPRSTGDGGYPFSGGCPVSCTRQIRWARFGDITAATPSNLIENPVNVTVGGYEQPLSKSHNVNVAFQRDIGFNTVAEIAWVGNYTWNHGRFVDDNRLPLYVYGDPANLVNNAPIAANSLRYQYGKYPGMGSANLYVPGALRQDAAVQRDADAARASPDQRAADGLLPTPSPRAKATPATTPTPTRSAAKRRSEPATGARPTTIAGTTSPRPGAMTCRRGPRCRSSSSCSWTGRSPASSGC